MSQKIDLDHGRFRQIIRGKIKQNLRKYISQGEMIGKKGKDTVSIPMPSGRHPALQARRQAAGRRRAGRRRRRRFARPGRGAAGPGRRPAIARAITCSTSRSRCRSSPRSWARSSSCPRIQPKGTEKIVAWKDKYSGIRTTGPRVAAPLPPHLSSRRCGARSRWAPTTRRTRSSSRSARTSATARGRASRCRSRTPSSST